jgi:hypothetical protein
MKIHTWLPAAGLLLFGGMAAAQEQERESEVKQEARELGEEAQESAEEVGQRAGSAVEEACQEAGRAVGEGVEEGARALAGNESQLDRGILEEGNRVRNTVTTNPIGLFLGEGLNATYSWSMIEKISLVAGGRYSRTRLQESALSAFGVIAGGDFYLVGQHNEGLRIGPRIEASLAQETLGEDVTSGAIGLLGELGYNWIAANGLTAGIAGGLRFEAGGDLDPSDGADLDAGWGPYGRLNVGYSW